MPTNIQALREQLKNISLDQLAESIGPDEEVKILMQAFATFLEGLQLPEKAFPNELDDKRFGEQAHYRQGYNKGVDQCQAALHQVVTALRGGGSDGL